MPIYPANDKREDYVRATVSRTDDGRWLETPFPKQDSSMLMTLAAADGLIRRPPFAPAIAEGETVDLFRFDAGSSL